MSDSIALSELRRQRGEARLDGKPFDDALIDRAEHELDAEQSAAAVAVEREREAAAAAMAERRAELVTDLLAAEKAYLESVGAAEQATRDQVAALDEVLRTAGDMRLICTRLQVRGPSGLDEGSLESRISERIVGVLTRIKRHPNRFGRLKYPPSWRTANENWTEKERAEIAADLSRIVKGN